MRRASGSFLLACSLLAGCRGTPPVFDHQAILARQTWWDNRDWDWYRREIPFFESPDPGIDATYYYRWELLTKHLTYGSPTTGYTFSEFIDRPFWSGAYGAISCPLGHQMAEARWLKDRRIVEDFARYWFETPGAAPRNYSNWYGDAVWGVYQVTGDSTFLRAMLPHMVAQYQGWVTEHWDPSHRMFRWDGMHDGMETNINSRQTTEPFSGAAGYRPTLFPAAGEVQLIHIADPTKARDDQQAPAVRRPGRTHADGVGRGQRTGRAARGGHQPDLARRDVVAGEVGNVPGDERDPFCVGRPRGRMDLESPGHEAGRFVVDPADHQRIAANVDHLFPVRRPSGGMGPRVDQGSLATEGGATFEAGRTGHEQPVPRGRPAGRP